MDYEQGMDSELHDRGIQLHKISGLNTYYIGFNMDDPVVGNNKALRQALSCAFNTKEWVQFYNGHVVRARGPIPPGVAGSTEHVSPYAYNLDKAKEYLSKAGYTDGIDPETGRRLQLTLELGSTDVEMRESTELFIDFMARMGVVIIPSYNSKAAFFDKVERRQAQLFRLSWFADYPDGQNFLQLFYSPNRSPGPNRVNYSNPEFDKLYEAAAIMSDSPERTAAYEKMADIVINDAPWLFLHHPVDYSMTQPWLKNYHPTDFPYGVEKYYRIDKRHMRPQISQMDTD